MKRINMRTFELVTLATGEHHGEGVVWSNVSGKAWGVHAVCLPVDELGRLDYEFTTLEELEEWARNHGLAVKEIAPLPVPMILHCPECRARHIDEGEFATKVHHTHSCQACGFTWRPAVVPTVGVRFLPGFKNKGRPVARVGDLVRVTSGVVLDGRPPGAGGSFTDLFPEGMKRPCPSCGAQPGEDCKTGHMGAIHYARIKEPSEPAPDTIEGDETLACRAYEHARTVMPHNTPPWVQVAGGPPNLPDSSRLWWTEIVRFVRVESIESARKDPIVVGWAEALHKLSQEMAKRDPSLYGRSVTLSVDAALERINELEQELQEVRTKGTT